MVTKSNTSELIPYQRKAIAVAISTAIVGTGSAQAQTESVLEEIIVTATKRSESLQDIPMSVTAFTDEKIILQGFK
jgi:iron complex outermembrane receptor protein